MKRSSSMFSAVGALALLCSAAALPAAAGSKKIAFGLVGEKCLLMRSGSGIPDIKILPGEPVVSTCSSDGTTGKAGLTRVTCRSRFVDKAMVRLEDKKKSWVETYVVVPVGDEDVIALKSEEASGILYVNLTEQRFTYMDSNFGKKQFWQKQCTGRLGEPSKTTE